MYEIKWWIYLPSGRLESLLPLQGYLKFTVQFVDPLVAQDGFGLLFALLVEDGHVEPCLKPVRLQVRCLDETLKSIMWLGRQGVQYPNTDPIYITVGIFVYGVLEGRLTLGVGTRFKVAYGQQVMNVPHLAGVVLDKLKGFFEIGHCFFDSVLFVVCESQVFVDLEIGLAVELHGFLVLLDGIFGLPLEFQATSYTC